MTKSSDCDLLIAGGGPCGIAAAISAQRAGLTPLVLEAHVICSTIAQYPTYVQFFSTAEKLSLGGVPFGHDTGGTNCVAVPRTFTDSQWRIHEQQLTRRSCLHHH